MTQSEACKILKAGYSVFLTGAPGSGKTYLLNEYIRYLKDRGVVVGVTASTGIAATHLGGFTIHSWAGIGIGRQASDMDIVRMATNRRVAKRFARAETLIIDEISMLDADRLDLVDRVARVAKGSFEPFGGMQIVLSGDFFQLPPVAREGEPPPRFAYHSRAWKTTNMKVCYLHEQYRQGDKEFVGVLNAIRRAEVDDMTVSLLRVLRNSGLARQRVTKLYSHNVDVNAENSRELARLSGKEKYYRMEVFGAKSLLDSLKNGCLASELVTVKKGAAVIFVKNNFEKGYVNGTLGTVSDFDEWDFPIVRTFSGREIVASPETWSIEENGRVLAKVTQVPLRLAWAITIHKSQGMTIDAAEIDLSDAFERGMGYVALSRVRSLAGIKLVGFNGVALQVSPEILAFDRELLKFSEETSREFRETPELPRESKFKERPKTYSVQKIRTQYRSAYEKWSPEEEERLLADFRADIALKVIAESLGRKYGAVYSRLKKLGSRGQL